MRAHAAVGRRLGISVAEIDDLIMLDPCRFERREWLALKYTQDRVFLDGADPAGEYVAEYEGAYSPREREYFRKLYRLMTFSNLWNNTFLGKAWREDGAGAAACSVPTQQSYVK